MTVVDWTKPGTPRSVARPSWIGGFAPSTRSLRPARLQIEELPPAPTDASIAPPSARGLAAPVVSVHPCAAPVVSIGPEASARVAELEVALEQARAALEQANADLARLESELATARARVLEEAEPEVVRLALTVAERVVGRELASDPSLLMQWVEEGLAALAGGQSPVVVAAPDVADVLREEVGAELVVSEAMAPGDCAIRDGASSVEVGVGARLAALADALGVDFSR